MIINTQATGFHPPPRSPEKKSNSKSQSRWVLLSPKTCEALTNRRLLETWDRVEPENPPFEKGKSSAKPSFLGSILIFRGVVESSEDENNKDHNQLLCFPPKIHGSGKDGCISNSRYTLQVYLASHFPMCFMIFLGERLAKSWRLATAFWDLEYIKHSKRLDGTWTLASKAASSDLERPEIFRMVSCKGGDSTGVFFPLEQTPRELEPR